MKSGARIKIIAWSIALVLVALPVVGVLNGWFASARWPITQLRVRAEFNHVSAEQISAAVAPLLGQGFFAMSLDKVRDAVARLPWVEHAEARKHWPDAIDLVVFEQQPYARWGGDRLVNREGGIFSIDDDNGLSGLPSLAGPDDHLGEVIRFYADTVREFGGSGLVITSVTLSPRGSWRLGLASGAVIEVGRENPHKRLMRFLDVWPRLVSANPQAPEYIDLRYENGFSMRWATPAVEPPTSSQPAIDAGPETGAVFALPTSRLLADSRIPISASRLAP